jgi:hypothetical protein
MNYNELCRNAVRPDNLPSVSKDQLATMILSLSGMIDSQCDTIEALETMIGLLREQAELLETMIRLTNPSLLDGYPEHAGKPVLH